MKRRAKHVLYMDRVHAVKDRTTFNVFEIQYMTHTHNGRGVVKTRSKAINSAYEYDPIRSRSPVKLSSNAVIALIIGPRVVPETCQTTRIRK